jgi:hypothetical protein
VALELADVGDGESVAVIDRTRVGDLDPLRAGLGCPLGVVEDDRAVRIGRQLHRRCLQSFADNRRFPPFRWQRRRG